MTSLQRAVQTQKPETKKGAFESSFAAGLDLTEFGCDCASSNHHTSAAAELLRVKAQEAQRAAQEEEKEVRILELAKQRGRELQTDPAESTVVQRHAAPQDSHSATDLMENANISATLVHMHGDDANGAHHKAKLRRNKRRHVEKSMRPMNAAVKGKKGAVKKSKRSKHYICGRDTT